MKVTQVWPNSYSVISFKQKEMDTDEYKGLCNKLHYYNKKK